ncbi:MAG TPA: histidine kinase [Streptosporangiaceae bacterium]|nr:histidine kinase [Streptosporangiaceae bacterium]
MGRYLLAAGVVLADTAILAAGHHGLPVWAVPAYALTAALVIAAGSRVPLAALAAALLLAVVTGASQVLLLWTAYQAGSQTRSRPVIAVTAAGALAGLGAQAATRHPDARVLSGLVATYVVFVALPMVSGCYLAQHRRVLSGLQEQNRRLRRGREALAEQERLRIARDMHDALGHRLSLVSVQAAALEVTDLPAKHRRAITQLAAAARSAVDDLQTCVGSLRSRDPERAQQPIAEQIDALARGFRSAGMRVALEERGNPWLLPGRAAQAAYRVAEEGLTNAAKHAPGQPVTVHIEWEPDTLLLSVANPVPPRPAPAGPGADREPGAGREPGADREPGPIERHGLRGLGERMAAVGGLLDHRRSGGQFRLAAMLPAVAVPPASDSASPPARPGRPARLGLVVAALMFVILPAVILAGVR